MDASPALPQSNQARRNQCIGNLEHVCSCNIDSSPALNQACLNNSCSYEMSRAWSSTASCTGGRYLEHHPILIPRLSHRVRTFLHTLSWPVWPVCFQISYCTQTGLVSGPGCYSDAWGHGRAVSADSKCTTRARDQEMFPVPKINVTRNECGCTGVDTGCHRSPPTKLHNGCDHVHCHR
jgi:hypothetical protein